MIRSTLLLTLLFSFLLTTGAVAQSGDEAAIKRIIQEALDGWNTGDVDKIMAGSHTETSDFGALTPFLEEGAGDGDDLRAAFAAGLSVTVASRHLQIKVYGTTAVATSYSTGSFTFGGTETSFTWRNSSIYAKIDGQWKYVHGHTSPVVVNE